MLRYFLTILLEVQVKFTQSVSVCFSKFADFSGRATRSEYWWFALASILFSYFFGFVIGFFSVIFESSDAERIVNIFIFLNSIIWGIPQCAVGSRRLHDIGKSGWWQLLYLTVIGVIPLIYWLTRPSHSSENEFGKLDNSVLNNKESSAADDSTQSKERGDNIINASKDNSVTAGKSMNPSSMEDAYNNAFMRTSVSEKILNFKLVDDDRNNVVINEDEIWEKVFKEFESDQRNLGLWARLFSEHEGNETKAKAEYLKIRSEIIRTELKISAATSHHEAKFLAWNDAFDKSEEDCIRNKIFNLYEALGHQIYIFPNGKAAYKRLNIFKIYENKDAAIKAVKIYNDTEILGRTGFIREFRVALHEDDKEDLDIPIRSDKEELLHSENFTRNSQITNVEDALKFLIAINHNVQVETSKDNHAGTVMSKYSINNDGIVHLKYSDEDLIVYANKLIKSSSQLY